MAFPGKFLLPSPLTHIKEKYYHEVAVMPKNIGGRETGLIPLRLLESIWEDVATFLQP
jgi:hypothetical protein